MPLVTNDSIVFLCVVGNGCVQSRPASRHSLAEEEQGKLIEHLPMGMLSASDAFSAWGIS